MHTVKKGTLFKKSTLVRIENCCWPVPGPGQTVLAAAHHQPLSHVQIDVEGLVRVGKALKTEQDVDFVKHYTHTL